MKKNKKLNIAIVGLGNIGLNLYRHLVKNRKSIIEKNNDYIVKTLPFDKYMGSFEIYEKYISDHMPVLFSFK